MIKVMLLLYRRPGMSPDDFRSYWHERHRPLLERLPGLRRLVLNDVLPSPHRTAAACDGIAADLFDSPAAASAATIAS
jgi:uncharacterized protein (TIGR02118 family)